MVDILAVFALNEVVNRLNPIPLIRSREPTVAGMFDLIRVFEIGVFVRFIPERFFYTDKGNGRPIVTLRCIIHVRFEKFIYGLICVERYEMAVACAYIQFETVFIPYKSNELIRNDDCFDIHAIYIRFAVD